MPIRCSIWGPAKRYAARFMTITCGVKDNWRNRIPAVVHVDGTARPQVIERAQNPLYYDILAAYKALHRRAGAGEHQLQRA